MIRRSRLATSKPSGVLADILEHITEHGSVTQQDVQRMTGLAPNQSTKRVHQWCQQGWLERVGKATYGYGWKALGRRKVPAHGSPEAKILNRTKVIGKITLAAGRAVLGTLDDSFVQGVIWRLIGEGWLKQGSGLEWVVAPDPFAPAEVRERVAEVIEEIRLGEKSLVAKKVS